jgi:hypothetical protein
MQEAAGLDGEREQAGTACVKRSLHGATPGRIREAEQASAAPGSADLGGKGASLSRAVNEIVDPRSGYARR